jgi:hypothetical protein
MCKYGIKGFVPRFLLAAVICLRSLINWLFNVYSDNLGIWCTKFISIIFKYLVLKESNAKRIPVFNYAPGHESTWRHISLAQRTLNLNARWKWVVGFTIRSLYYRYPLKSGLAGAQSRCGHFAEENFAPPWNRITIPQSFCLVTTPTKLAWLQKIQLLRHREQNPYTIQDEPFNAVRKISIFIGENHRQHVDIGLLCVKCRRRWS